MLRFIDSLLHHYLFFKKIETNLAQFNYFVVASNNYMV
ncbi:hypothetical protein ASZ90_011886 [hydrocarbon metagenome]|uniref:Uncharacterized protein n=1 Tax=hydrocarbon metagenome TaxID=938273 RepID=A0A0W8FCF3_9ZZZZ